jgi:CheY-like chemotaxis protein
MKIISCVDDIFFASKINAAAKAAHVEIVAVLSSPDAVAEQTKWERPFAVLLDLNSRKLDPILIIRTLKSDPETRSVPIIGFLSHIQTDLYEKAAAAGCDRILPRSKFSQDLPKILSGIF